MRSFHNSTLFEAGFKATTASLLGLIALWLNLHAYQFELYTHNVSIMGGLIFPLMVSLAWGWRYGLAAAIIGVGGLGLWRMQGDLPDSLNAVPMLIQTAWVIWHGWCAERRKSGRNPHWNIYLAELIFRIGGSLILYAVWTIHLINYHPAAGALWPLVHLVVIIEALWGLFNCLIADALLQLGLVRKIMGLEKQPDQLTTSYVIGIAFSFGLLFWIVDGLVDYYRFQEQLRFLIFKGPDQILDSLIFKVSSINLFQRMIFIMTCLIAGLLVARLLRKHLEAAQALRKSEVRFRRLHESMRDAFVQFDLSGRVLDFNHAFQEMIGYDPVELMAMTEHAFTPAKWHSHDTHTIAAQVLSHGKSEVYEKEYIRKDGEVFPVELRFFLISDDQGNPSATGAIVRDITARKKAEQERDHMMVALQRSNEDLQQFAYVASHDLQEPLRMVSSYTHLLAQRYGDQLDDKARKFIGYAVEGAVRMQALIQDLLAYSRVDTRGVVPEPVDANRAVEKALANLRSVIEDAGAQIEVSVLPEVQADENQLAMVLQNLIHNGIKFCRGKLPHIAIAAIQRGGEWVFSVKDNGIGIEPKYSNKIFVIFQRLHTREEYHGTGIGLALCKKIIERHNGRIWFESEPGAGSTFFFSLSAVDKGGVEHVGDQQDEACGDITCGG